MMITPENTSLLNKFYQPVTALFGSHSCLAKHKKITFCFPKQMFSFCKITNQCFSITGKSRSNVRYMIS